MDINRAEAVPLYLAVLSHSKFKLQSIPELQSPTTADLDIDTYLSNIYLFNVASSAIVFVFVFVFWPCQN